MKSKRSFPLSLMLVRLLAKLSDVYPPEEALLAHPPLPQSVFVWVKPQSLLIMA